MQHQVGRVEFLGSFLGELPLTGLPEVAFAGRSNVGKSSAINCMLGRKAAARVSGRPGRTRAINLFRVGDRLVFADLPGYGYAAVPDHVQEEWKAAIEAYLGEREALKLVVVLVDARRKPQPMDGQLLYALIESGIPSLVVATKIDKLKRRERDQNLGALRDEFRLKREQLIAFSSVTRDGRSDVWRVIEQAARA